ncbi:uncharacterized protein ACHE_10284A [Aspergillus chevalieri]|uniref:Uncharacterized protein n=1 Tax=Aspergillus chevalieri TaxID=182096 RepID=A0A7R7VEP6_ASPCH|nr:uncharacterized protein ACHE_10284A [Aspergillus chevalieri]BCR82882.1 hypothetical protein ACHE_10284A [Aspergillus chevalieri]
MPSKITSAINILVVNISLWKDPQDRIGRLQVAQEIVDASKNVGFVPRQPFPAKTCTRCSV